MASTKAMKNIKNVANVLYDGAADIGKATVSIGFIFMILASIGMFIGGIVLLAKKYPESDNNDIVKKSSNDFNKTVGYILIFSSILVVIMTSVYYYYFRNSKPMNALAGADMVGEMIFGGNHGYNGYY